MDIKTLQLSWLWHRTLDPTTRVRVPVVSRWASAQARTLVWDTPTLTWRSELRFGPLFASRGSVTGVIFCSSVGQVVKCYA